MSSRQLPQINMYININVNISISTDININISISISNNIDRIILSLKICVIVFDFEQKRAIGLA